MRHHNKNKKFSRVRKTRKALVRSLARSLILREKIHTTEMKAKALRPIVEKLVSHGKVKNQSVARLLSSRVGEEVAQKILNVLAPRYLDRKGGYLRIIKLGRRSSDAVKKAQIEFV